MKKRKFSVMLVVLSLVVVMGIPVSAKTSRLDVRAGDIYSWYTVKDSGSQWENLYYVTTETYVGYPVIAQSVSRTGTYSSGALQVRKGAHSYSYGGIEVPGGIEYRLVVGPSYMSGADWHLTGRYTP